MIPLAAVTMVSSVVGAVVAHGFASWLAYSDELTNWGALIFTSIGFSTLQGTFAWNVLIAGAGAISLFCAGFYLVSLGLKDVAFRGNEKTTRRRRLRSTV
jgi:ABC-type dipeptide/oligopeptide/nickel transport system permease subunit